MKKSLVKKSKLKNSKDFRTIFIKCTCGDELLIVRHDSSLNMIEISVHDSNIVKNKMTIWQKLRYVYFILRNGQPYYDQIILEKNQIKELSSFLNSI